MKKDFFPRTSLHQPSGWCLPGVSRTTRSSCARSSSRWKAWFRERAGPRRASGAVLALVTPSTWMARKTSLLSSDLMDETSDMLAVRIQDGGVVSREKQVTFMLF